MDSNLKGDCMFVELMPLIQLRPLTITVAPIGDKQLCVNVIPKPLEKDKAANGEIKHTHEKEVARIPESAIKAVATPLTITGTPEEIDSELAKTLKDFTSTHISLQVSLDNASKQIKEAVKAIDERERVKKEKDKASKKPGAKPDDKKKAADEPGLPSLFTAQDTTPSAVSANDATQPGHGGNAASGSDEHDDDAAEGDEEGTEQEGEAD
jgi:PRTRC genetic system protein E